MKRFLTVVILVLLCIGIAGVAPAGDRKFVWDKNTESDLKHYTLYRASNPNVAVMPANLYHRIYKPGENPNAGDPVNVEYIDVGSTCELPRNILPDGTYYFVMTASDEAGNESGKSNEVSTVIDDTAPAPPGGLQCDVTQ